MEFERGLILLLVFFRMIGVIGLLPILGVGKATIPKIALSFMLAILIFPNVNVDYAQKMLHGGPLHYFVLVISEFLIGFMMGLIIELIFSAVRIGFSLAGYQMGFGLARQIDPTVNEQQTLSTQFAVIFAGLIFFATNMHLAVIKNAIVSYKIIPLGHIVLRPALGREVLSFTGKMFLSAVKLGAPLIGMMLIVMLLFAFMAKAIPQVNVYFMALPMKIGIGILCLALCLPYLTYVIVAHFDEMIREIQKVIFLLKP